MVDPNHQTVDKFRNHRQYVDIYRNTDKQKTKKLRERQTEKQKETNTHASKHADTFANKQTNKDGGLIEDQLWGGKCVDRVHSEPR